MDTSLILCEELYNNITMNESIVNYKLTFAPDQPQLNGLNYFIDKQSVGQTTELVCFKSTFLKTFLEAHTYFNAYVVCNEDESDLWKRFYCTVGYLLTTPENKMIINIHEEALLQILLTDEIGSGILLKELMIIQRLLTSTKNSLNKSSSMWYLYRKLYIWLNIYEKIDENQIIENLLVTFRNSSELHTCNYYCWNTVRWFYDIVPSLENKIKIFEMTKLFCFVHIRDCSSWDALSYMACQQLSFSNYNIEDYNFLKEKYTNILKKNSSMDRSVDGEILEIDISYLLDQIIKCVDSLRISDWPPFLCIQKVADIQTKSNIEVSKEHSFIAGWAIEIQDFEEKHGKIELKNGNPIVSKETENDLMISTLILHYGWKKRILSHFK